MSKDDKSAVLQAVRKMKKANRNVDEIDDDKNSGSKNRRNDEDNDIADSIINAVKKLTGRD